MARFTNHIRFTALLLLLCLTAAGAFAQASSPTAEEDYLVQFTTMLNKSQKRLDLMNRKGTLEKLGEEELNGLISGKVTYKTTIKGLSGIVTLTYDNYCDDAGWVFSGQVIVKSNMAANGTFDGKISVSGSNPGTVYYDKVTMKSEKPAGGSYGVELPGKKRAEVDYSWYFKAEK